MRSSSRPEAPGGVSTGGPAMPSSQSARSCSMSPRAARSRWAGGTSSGSGAGSSRVKVTKRATKTYAAGKTALDHDVVRFQCEKCGSSRVGTEETKSMTCGLCTTPMRRLR